MPNPEYDILNSIDDSVLIINRDYEIVFANQSFLKLQRSISEDLIGEKCYRILHLQSVPCLEECILKTVFQEAIPVTRNYSHLLKDGSKRVFQISASPLKNEQGEVVRMLQILKDITRQHQSETALATRHQELERIFNSAPFTISYLDRQMRVIRLNPAMEKFINRKTEEVRGQFCYDIWGQYKKDETRKGKQRLCDSCSSQYALKDGQRHVFERWLGDTFFEVVSVPVMDQDNSIIGVLEIGNDITKRKQAEEALELERNNFRNILNSMDDGVYIVNAHHDIEYVNTVLKKEFGEILGRKCFSYFHDRNEVCPWCKNKEILQGKTVHWEWYSHKTKKSYDLVATPLKNPDGTLSKLEIFRDITQQKKLQRKSDQHLQQIIQTDKLVSLGEVVAGVAHEINNPNSFISYNTPLLEEIWQVLQPLVDRRGTISQETGLAGIAVSELCQDMGDIIEAIKVGSERINRVVSNLKDFARMDESSHTDFININEIINKTYSIVGAQVRKSVRNIEFHLASELPLITGHFQKLEQVIANLLINAGHALQKQNKGKLVISTDFVERLNAVIVSIEDNGVGMEPGAMARLFEPFFTTRRDSGGTGLGLSASYGLIQEHAGCIGVLSRPGIGTRFTLFLPKDLLSDRLNLHPAILLVDEDKNLSALREVLQEITESTIFTFNGQGNISSFLEEHPEVDIVLSTTRGSHINGWQLLEEVKKQSPLMAVFLYDEGGDEQIRNPTSFEPDCLLQQPFGDKAVRECIDSITRIRL